MKNETDRSHFKETLLEAMNTDDRYWKNYYRGSKDDVEYKKIYSYSDRCRYYLPDTKISNAIDRLLNNTSRIPEALVSQYFPRQYEAVLNGEVEACGEKLLLERLGNWCDGYASACGINI